MLLVEPLQPSTAVPYEIPHFDLLESLMRDYTILEGLSRYLIGEI